MSRKLLVATFVGICLTALVLFGSSIDSAGSASADDPYAPAPAPAPLVSSPLSYQCTWPSGGFDLTTVFHVPGTLAPDATNVFAADLTFDQHGVEHLQLAYPKTINATVLADDQASDTTLTAFLLGTKALNSTITIAKTPTPPLVSAHTFAALPGVFAPIDPAQTGSQQVSVPTKLDLIMTGTDTPCVLAAGSGAVLGTVEVAPLTPTIETAPAKVGLAVTVWATCTMTGSTCTPSAPGAGTVTATTTEPFIQHYVKRVWVHVKVRVRGRHGKWRWKRKHVRRPRTFKRVVIRKFTTHGTLNAQGRTTLNLAALRLRPGDHKVAVSWEGSTIEASYLAH